ncbi:MAG: hemerythrin domain-containing protein [Myxococcota bacterium]
MELQVVRKNLLAQHENLRTLMTALEAALDGKDRAKIEKAVRALHDACQAHNAAEEATLVPILRDIDAWGPERVKQLLDEHTEEHAVLLKKIDPKAPDAALRTAITELREHMAHEEDTNLAEALLRDDVVNVDAD